jgi:aspartate/methionine/tyrosine aminotransferase
MTIFCGRAECTANEEWRTANVAIIPGDAFGAAYKNYVRISYCVDLPTLTEALQRIAGFVSGDRP